MENNTPNKKTPYIFILFFLFFLNVASNTAARETYPLSKQRQYEIMAEVAKEYSLTPDQFLLLQAIRLAENGGVGREFGVLNKEAMRFKTAEKSFPCQCRWCAGTIKKRFTGDIVAFSRRYCPIGANNDPGGLNKNWVKNVRYFINKIKKEGWR